MRKATPADPIPYGKAMTVVKEKKGMDYLRRRIPIFGWLPKYTWNIGLQDALAGLTVSFTVIPQSIAYAAVAGLPSQYGLYSGFMGCFVYMIFGSAKDISVGPTAIMALLVQPYVATLGEDIAVLLCFLSGCIITAMGILHLGFLVNFISMPVICGFTNAAAIIIASSQFSKLVGLSGRSETFVDAIMKLITKINDVQVWDSVLGFSCIIILVILKHLPGRRNGSTTQKCMWIISLGRNAIVVVAGIILTYVLSTYGYEPIQLTGNITEGLPPFELPPFFTVRDNVTYNFKEMTASLGGTLATVPLIAILESVAIAKAFAKGRSLDANQEMLALGLCNLLGSFVRSMPIAGSFTRTAVNHASGVQTTMGGIVTGSLVLLACGLLTSTFKFIPKATLASVIIVAMYYMLDFNILVILWRTKKIDLLPLTVTFLTCLLLSLDYGMAIGITLNLVLLLYFMARPGLTIEERNIDGTNICFVSPKQSLSFPAAEYLRDSVMSWCDSRHYSIPVIVEGGHVYRIDATVAKNLKLLQLDLETRNQKLIFWNWCESARSTLTNYDSSLHMYFRSSDTLSELFIDENTRSSETREIKIPDNVSTINT